MHEAALVEPSNSTIQHDLGLACLEAGRIPDAIAALQQAVTSNPRYSDAYLRLGVALEKLGDIGGAIVAYDRATELHPSLTGAWFRAGALVHMLARFRLGFWVIILGTLAIFPVVGYQIARQGIRPVEEMAATARRISSTHLGERILTEGYPFELASLAGTLNEMLDRLEDSFARISQFSADIAHDLRTPVNNTRGEAEVALARARTIDEYRDALEPSLEESVRLSDLIGNLLFLARTESPLTQLRRERINVAELLNGVQEYYEAAAADGGIALSTRFGVEPVIAEVDRTLMQRAVGNLVSNAVAHTHAGGSVVMATGSESAVVRIEVTDTGIGIPPEALPRVFDRFFRVDPSRSQASGGTGLDWRSCRASCCFTAAGWKLLASQGKGLGSF